MSRVPSTRSRGTPLTEHTSPFGTEMNTIQKVPFISLQERHACRCGLNKVIVLYRTETQKRLDGLALLCVRGGSQSCHVEVSDLRGPRHAGAGREGSHTAPLGICIGSE